MDIVELPAEEDAVRRFVEELWLPYNLELEATTDQFALADDVDLITEEVPFRLDRVDSEGYRVWIAIEGATDAATLADMGGEFVGFIAGEIDEAPSVFDRPDRLFICDIYVRDPHRGTELATDLFDRLEIWAREAGCKEFSLDPHVDNNRAIAFYEKIGFETTQYHMVASIED
ncbi:GNAT family N-acetyltransferase [Haloarcula sp. CBA1130]|uniref:GNAT family N-acetyltransferase n=1 Tax=unclassified Haloarcula TaxID=2624677 RepID=UPI001243F9EC|nr:MULTISPECIES: GNAT family N-acetyltransferase [unclassified Haloarcula]KAA9395795.1 GNAT family N-acetyltransferase [Haloarcula sp. CBA1129]KAA9400273.1 GNAT family N-acetyltransferase [Haloarcula sp. CBA1130]